MSNQPVAPIEDDDDGTPVEACPKCGAVHDPAKCQKHVKPKEPGDVLRQCKRTPKPGTDPPQCVMHGAKAPQVVKKAAQRVAQGKALAELEALGHPIPIDPADAMLSMVHEAAGNVAVLRSLANGLGLDVTQTDSVGEFGSKRVPHVLVTMYDAERERLVKWAKACRDAGVDERRVQLAEADGQRLATALSVLAESLIALVPAKAAESLRGQLPVLYRKAIETTATEAA